MTVSVDPAEIAKFAALAEDWWNPEGKFRPLHALNPSRLAFIRDQAASHFGRDPLAPSPLADLEVLDIGCGGGLVSEPLARLGAKVTGIDASPDGLQAAAAHAAEPESLSIIVRVYFFVRVYTPVQKMHV